MSNTAFLFLNYDELNPSDYRNLELHIPNFPNVYFDTGDILIDWLDYCLYIWDDDFYKKHNIKDISYSSTIDNFQMDTKYFLNYYDPETNLFVEIDGNEEEDFYKVHDNYPHAFFTKRMKNFNDLIKYYHKHKK